MRNKNLIEKAPTAITVRAIVTGAARGPMHQHQYYYILLTSLLQLQNHLLYVLRGARYFIHHYLYEGKEPSLAITGPAVSLVDN